MCNLYDIGPSRKKARTAFEAAALEFFPSLRKTTLIRKTDPGLVVTATDGGYTAQFMRWGFVREFNSAINNTRSDKLAGTMWGEALAKRRCLVPVAAFYEWNGPPGAKQAHRLESPRTLDWLWVAGLHETHPGHGPCFSMITTDAPPWMAPIHHRLIAIFDDLAKAEEYLRSDDPAPAIAPPRTRLAITPCPSPLKKSGQQPTLF